MKIVLAMAVAAAGGFAAATVPPLALPPAPIPVVEPASPASVAAPAAPASVDAPAAPASVAEPAAPASVAAPAAPASVAEPAAPASVAEPAAPASIAAPMPAQASMRASTEKCGVVYERAPGSTTNALLPSMQVHELADDADFALPADAPPKVKAVQCERDAIVPQPNDYKVLAAGFPFAIIVGSRVGVIEGVDGKLRFRMIKGATTPAEQAAAGEILDAAQPAFEKAVRARKLFQ